MVDPKTQAAVELGAAFRRQAQGLRLKRDPQSQAHDELIKAADFIATQAERIKELERALSDVMAQVKGGRVRRVYADYYRIDDGEVRSRVEALLSAHPQAAPSLPADVTDAMVDRALMASVPGGSEVWCWLPQKDAWTPSDTAKDVMRCALKAALAPFADRVAGEEEIDHA